MTSGTRTKILESALDILRDGDSITLESAARRVGITKPGLMYHFPTKEALMLGVVDHVVDRWEAELSARVGNSPELMSASDRISAFLDFALTGKFDETDLAALADPRLRESLTKRWVERTLPWYDVGNDLDDDDRGRLLAVRLIADGAWFDGASRALTLTVDDRRLIYEVAHTLLHNETPH